MFVETIPISETWRVMLTGFNSFFARTVLQNARLVLIGYNNEKGDMKWNSISCLRFWSGSVATV